MPTDRINYHGTLMTFQECEDEGFCKSFDTLKEARAFSTTEELNLEDSNDYANQAMESERVYGCEGVDDMRFEC
jgi:hypothetical protein